MDILSLRSILKFNAYIGLAISIFFLIPIGAGLIYSENIKDFFLFDLLLFAGNFAVIAFFFKHNIKLGIKESIISVNLVWILCSLWGAIPLLLYTDIGFWDAFFEAVSGFTTTGATIYTDIDSLPKWVLLLRSLMHWLGGMGIIVLGVGLFSLINPTGSLTLFKAESTGIKLEKLTPKIKDTAIRLWGIYLFLTLIDTLLLKIGGMNLFDAVNHAFSTISTGGFSTKTESLGHWQSPFILWVTTVFMIISGINFLAHLKLFYKDFRAYNSEEVKWYLKIFLLLSILLTTVHFFSSGDTFFDSITHSFFTIASILTTTGFASLDYEQWGAMATALVFAAMLIGGNAGSTAGGAKVIRYVVLFKNLSVQIKRILHPSAVIGIFVDGQRIKNDVLGSTAGFLLLFAATNTLIALYLFARGYDTLTSVSTAIAIVGNIGPGFSLTGPAQNYALFSWADKALLSFGMIAGRLEFYTVIMLFSREFWKRF
ncbi:TrkH family potassium uptake protein [Nitrosophilus alvini]|uniref:TrkH family potassium uptake protein n=1 Tax=Nitrosophilus alvini TaxID=2714855 RepID=UPI00190B18A2|nr:TrkH family potassium uptake protein [Nitrosophilus alvini]